MIIPDFHILLIMTQSPAVEMPQWWLIANFLQCEAETQISKPQVMVLHFWACLQRAADFELQVADCQVVPRDQSCTAVLGKVWITNYRYIQVRKPQSLQDNKNDGKNITNKNAWAVLHNCKQLVLLTQMQSASFVWITRLTEVVILFNSNM